MSLTFILIEFGNWWDVKRIGKNQEEKGGRERGEIETSGTVTVENVTSGGARSKKFSVAESHVFLM